MIQELKDERLIYFNPPQALLTCISFLHIYRNAVVGIFVLLVLLTLILIFWPRKTKEEELAGSLAKKVGTTVAKSGKALDHIILNQI